MNISNREKWEQLLPVFSELSSLVSALCDLEDSLTVSASKNDLEELTRLVSEAQPTLLRFRGLEQKRVKLQKECGFASNFRDSLKYLSGIEGCKTLLFRRGMNLKAYFFSPIFRSLKF